MKKIIVTGANGFVGSSLMKELQMQNFEPIGLVRKGANAEFLSENASIIFIDYDDEKQLKTILAQGDILVHIAARTKAKNWQQMQNANVDLTNKLIKLFNTSKKMKQFIFISSQAASGPAANIKSPKKESDVNSPKTIYGKSKLLAENLVQSKIKKNWTIIRPVSVFGANDKDFLQFFKMIKSHFVISASFNEKYFNLIYIDDLVKIIIQSFGNNNAFGEIFFATNHSFLSQIEFANIVATQLNKKYFTIKIPFFIMQAFAFFNQFFSRKFPTLNLEKCKELKENFWLVNPQKTENMLGVKIDNNLDKQIALTIKEQKKKGWL